jgi:hypothetical protein
LHDLTLRTEPFHKDNGLAWALTAHVGRAPPCVSTPPYSRNSHLPAADYEFRPNDAMALALKARKGLIIICESDGRSEVGHRLGATVLLTIAV